MGNRATKTVLEVGKINFSGNVHPPAWHKEISNPWAIFILGEIVYWHRPRILKDETTGDVVEIQRRFSGELLQRTINSFADQFNISYKQARDAINYLQDELGVITKVLRTVDVNGRKFPNTLFIDLHPDILLKITHPEPSDSEGNRSDSEGNRSDSEGNRSDSEGNRSDSEGNRSIPESQTITENTTESTTENTTESDRALDASHRKTPTDSTADPFMDAAMQKFNRRNGRRGAPEHITQAAGLGIDAAELTGIVNAILKVCGLEELADDPMDDSVLAKGQTAALQLIRMGYTSDQAVFELRTSMIRNEYLAGKAIFPANLTTYASQLKSGAVLGRNGNGRKASRTEFDQNQTFATDFNTFQKGQDQNAPV